MHCYRKNLLLCLTLIPAVLFSYNAFATTTGVNTPGGGTVSPLYLGTGGNTYVTIDATGNVGIGVTNPQYVLDVGPMGGSQTATSGGLGLIRNNAAADTAPFTQARIMIYGGAGVDGTNYAYLGYGNDANMRIVYGNTTQAHALEIGEATSYSGGGTFTPELTVNAGNVVIGATSSQTPFEVKSTTFGYVGTFYGSNGGAAAVSIGARLGAGAIQAYTSDNLAAGSYANLGLNENGGVVGIGAVPGGGWELEVHAPANVHGIYAIPSTAANWAIGGWTQDGQSAGGLGVANWAGVYGVGASTGWAGYFSGNVYVTGNVQSGAYYHNSDARLKTDIKPIDHALDKILALKGVEFNWKKDGRPDMGMTAQNVEQVFPNVVEHGPDGMMSVEYDSMVAPLIEAIRELKAKDDQTNRRLETENNQLEAEIADIKKSLKKAP